MKTSLVRCLSVAIFIALLTTATSSIEKDLASILDSVLCEDVEPSYHMIVDIRLSMDRGADLIDGILAKNMDKCVSECCDREKCSLVLFKENGASSSGKDCYFITCGDSIDNCVMVPHHGFTTVTVRAAGKATGKGSIDKNTVVNAQPTSLSQSTPSQSATPTSISTPPLIEAKTEKDITSSDPVTDPTTGPSPQSSPVPSPQSSSNHVTTLSVKIPEEASASRPVDVTKDGLNIIIEENIPHVLSPEADCSKGGCRRDPGVISMVVVGVVCLTVLVIVGAVLVRKVFNDQRKKRFRNVDYLINGMYT